MSGDGPPLSVCPAFVECFSFERLVQPRHSFFESLEQEFRVIRFDLRGTGFSTREVTDFSLKRLSSDIASVLNALGLESTLALAEYLAGPSLIHFAASHPGRVTKLALLDTFSDPHLAFEQEEAYRAADWAQGNWDRVAQFLQHFVQIAAGQAEVPNFTPGFGRLFAKSTTGGTIWNLVHAAYDWNADRDLRLISVPSCILSHMEQYIFSPNESVRMSNSLFGSELIPLIGLPGPIGVDRDEMDTIRNHIVSFLHGRVNIPPTSQPAAGQLKTVLFTDLVGHTEMMQRLGDTRGVEILHEHEAITRGLLRQFEGTEIKTMGDGFMMSFSSVSQAIRCAISLQKAFDERNNNPQNEPLDVRVGMTAGEPIQENEDLFGNSVIIASRIAQLAQAREILVSDVIRGLCAGKAFQFRARGPFDLKGIDEPVHIFEITWQNGS